MATVTSSLPQKHLAVLIDADNAPAAIVEGLFEEIAKYGVASVKRIYGDWTGPQLGGWKKVLLGRNTQWHDRLAGHFPHMASIHAVPKSCLDRELSRVLPRTAGGGR